MSYKITRLLAALCVCSSGCLAGNWTNGEIWIAPGPTKAGTGTVTGTGTYGDPYVGDFDVILANAPARSDMHMLPGVFYSKAKGSSSNLKEGQRLRGAGIDLTVLRRDTFFGSGRSHALLSSTDNNIEVADLTVDGQYASSEPQNCNGVILLGVHEVIRRVKVINIGGTGTAECFPIIAGSYGDTGTAGNLISECEVSSNKGNYGGAICMFAQGLVEKCRVYLPPMSNTQPPFYSGYGSARGPVTFAHNLSVGGAWGYYNDSWWDTNITFIDNHFVAGRGGINIAKASTGIVGLNILNNVIELHSNAYLYSAGITLWGNRALANVNISGNLIHFLADQSAPTNSNVPAIIINPAHVRNLKVVNNTFGTNMAIHAGTTTCVWSGNTDTDGKTVSLAR